MDDQTDSDLSDQDAALDVDEAATDVCKRCSEIPWLDPPEDFRIWIKPFSPTCRICRLLCPSCQKYKPRTEVELAYRPVPSEIQDQLDEHRCQLRAFRMYGNTRDEDGKFIFGQVTILVSDLSHEQAEMAFQWLSIPPVMSLSRIGDHIRDCVTNHGHTCSLQQSRQPLHLRVIDCNTRTVVNAPADCDYVALSYVWGKACDVQEQDIRHEVPLTVEHSIYVTVELGFQYLWIDRYCINQQDHQHRDDQINQMSTIYAAAQLTIVAAAGSDPTHGLPGVAQHPRPGLVNHETLNQVCLTALRQELYHSYSSLEIVAQSVWASRAWTYQEAMFSRRRLIFTENQAIFSCNENTYFESGRVLSNYGDHSWSYLLPWYNLVQGRSNLGLKPITEIMQQYCERTLSYESDALRAISGTLNLLLKDKNFHLWGTPGRILTPVCTDQEEHQQTHQQTRLGKKIRTFDDFGFSLHLDWRSDYTINTDGRRRRRDFPSWSPLGWSSGAIYWSGDLPYIGRISCHTSLGPRDLSEFIQYARTDHTKIPQQLSLSLKTAVVEVCEDGYIAYLLDSRLQVLKYIYSWNGSKAADGTLLKTAVIGESNEDFFLLLLEATGDGIYERRGSCFIKKRNLTEPYTMPGLRIRHDDSEEEGSSHKCDDGGTWTFVKYLEDLDPADKERIRASYGDLETWEWWKNISFTEERIILG